MVKKWLLILAVVMVGVSGFAQAQRMRFTDIMLKTEFLATPTFKTDNYASIARLSSQWLVVQVSFMVPNFATKAGNASQWLDDIRMETEVIFPGHYDGQPIPVYATGKTEFWAIPLDGKKHYAMAFISPQVLKRYCAETNYKKISVAVRVTFYESKNNLMIGQASTAGAAGKKGKEPANLNNLFERFSGPVAERALRLPNVILPLDKSPWALIDYDRFDMIKKNDGK